MTERETDSETAMMIEWAIHYQKCAKPFYMGAASSREAASIMELSYDKRTYLKWASEDQKTAAEFSAKARAYLFAALNN